jgi:hypothetical protein
MILIDFNDSAYGIGDAVAYCVRDGGSTTMKVGIVRNIVSVNHPWKAGVKINKLKVEIIKSSCSYDSSLGKVVTIECLDRVLKLGPANVEERKEPTSCPGPNQPHSGDPSWRYCEECQP